MLTASINVPHTHVYLLTAVRADLPVRLTVWVSTASISLTTTWEAISGVCIVEYVKDGAVE